MMQEENKRPDEELVSPNAPTEDTAEGENVFSAFEEVAKPQPAAGKKRLSSNTRLLIAVTAIVAALAILLAVLLPLLNDGTDGSSDVSGSASAHEQVYPLYDRSKDDTKEAIVRSVTIKTADGEYTIRYNAEQKLYQLVGYEDLATAASGIETLTDCSTTLNAYDRVKTVESLKDFGLETPQATVTVTYHDNSTNTLLIGDLTPDKAAYYVRLKDSNDVYIVQEDSVSYFLLTKEQYIDRTLLTMPTVKDDDENGSAVLKELTLRGGANNETLTLRRATSSDGLEYSYATYVITKPYMRMMDETVSQTLEGFTYLVADQAAVLHPTAADKQKYGFNDPYVVLDVALAVETIVSDGNESSTTEEAQEDVKTSFYNEIKSKITVGSKDENGNYYVMVDDYNAIYQVFSSSLSAIAERTYENTISELLFIKDITALSKVRIKDGDKTYDFLLTHDATKEEVDEKLTVVCDGKTLSTPDFRQLYSLMIGLARYGQTKTAPTGNADNTMAVYLNDGATYLSLDFFKTSGSLYTVRTTEGELFTVKASDFTNLITQMNNLLAGKAVIS